MARDRPGVGRDDWAERLEIGPALLTRSLTDPGVVGAILRHEYGHHRLLDVARSRVLLWAGYVRLLLTVPFVLTIWAVGLGTSLAALIRLAGCGRRRRRPGRRAPGP